MFTFLHRQRLIPGLINRIAFQPYEHRINPNTLINLHPQPTRKSSPTVTMCGLVIHDPPFSRPHKNSSEGQKVRAPISPYIARYITTLNQQFLQRTAAATTYLPPSNALPHNPWNNNPWNNIRDETASSSHISFTPRYIFRKNYELPT